MTRVVKPKTMGPSPTSPTIKEWADLDTPIEGWQLENSGFLDRVSAFKTHLASPNNRALVVLALKYIIGYTIISVAGTHFSLLTFAGLEMWHQLNVLATLAPIAISAPLAAHGVYIHIKSIQLNTKYKHLLDHDDLTGLNSRRYMFEQLENHPSQFNYLFMVDMDQLKRLNDQMGHLAGDAALIRIASILSAATKTGDAVGRLSGDEFMVLSTAESADEVLMIAQRALDKFQDENQGHTKAQAVTVSMGIAKISPESSVSTTVHEADKALYCAKQKGGNCFQFAGASKDTVPPPETTSRNSADY